MSRLDRLDALMPCLQGDGKRRPEGRVISHDTYTGSRTRTDSVAVSMGATPVETRPDGSKVYEGAASFGDVVKRYPDLRPPRNEFIPADEAMSPEALRLLEGLRFTAGTRSRDWDGKITLAADHTPDLDDPNGEAIEGVVLKGWRHDSDVPGEPPELRVNVLVYTRAAQELLEKGVRDLSFGFRCDEERKDGVHQGVPYSVIQRNIRYYHLALVTSARSRTPSGRRARFDSYPSTTTRRPAPTPTRPHVRTPMQRSHLLLATLAVLSGQTPPAAPAMVPATDDKGAPRLDAAGAPMMVYDAAAGPVLSEADAALLKQMSPEAQAALGAALGSAVAAADETAGDEMEGEAEESAEVAADEEQDAAMLAPVLAKVDAILAALEAAGIKVGAAKGDEMPPAATKMDAEVAAQVARNKAEMQSLRNDIAKGDPKGLLKARLDGLAAATSALSAKRKDSATVTTPTSAIKPIDPAAIIAAATEAAVKRTDANAAFVQVVRNDHAGVATVEQAAIVMLATIKDSLPGLMPMAEEALKSQRLDALSTLYKQAESIRRDSILENQSAGLARVLATADLGPLAGKAGNGGGTNTGNIIRAPGRS